MNIIKIPVKKWSMVGFLLLTIVMSWTSFIDTKANEVLGDNLYRSSVVFAFAKGLDAAISVIQGTQISVSPIGLGFTISIGQLLDPINVIVEQFSNLMLVASVALGIQKVFIAIGSHQLVKWLFFLISGWLILRVMNNQQSRYLKKAYILIIMIRFSVSFATIGSGMFFDTFLDTQYKVSKDSIAERTIEVKGISTAEDVAASMQQSSSNGSSWWSGNLPKIPSMGDLKQRIDQIESGIKDIAERTTESIINLLVVFALQTIIFPVGFLWIIYRFSTALLSDFK
jgi:hypothetical protein